MQLLAEIWLQNDYKLVFRNGKDLELTWSQCVRLLFDVSNVKFDELEGAACFAWDGKLYSYRPRVYVISTWVCSRLYTMLATLKALQN